jgi:RNA polymerase sigma-70 factor (ECF subfamily)
MWADLIPRIAAGDQRALAALYDGSSRHVHGLALRILRDAGAAEEVTHDVYLQVWRQAAEYRESRGEVFSWLFTLARSRAIDRLRSAATRRRKLETSIEEAHFLASPESGADVDRNVTEVQESVRAALVRLSAEQREAIAIAYFEGLSHSEIAQKLDQPLGTVKTRIRLGMMKLREMLAHLEA